MSIIHHLAVPCPCESSELSISNMGRISYCKDQDLYCALCVANISHQWKKVRLEQFFFRRHHFVKVNLFAGHVNIKKKST